MIPDSEEKTAFMVKKDQSTQTTPRDGADLLAIAGAAVNPIDIAGVAANPINIAGIAANPINIAGMAANPINTAGMAANPINIAGMAAKVAANSKPIETRSRSVQIIPAPQRLIATHMLTTTT